ncbi:MAG TPA: asparagine synthase (glutamine-hydrolyzing) [Blastocatellia bacterium]|nr:asparagine synthase (glutamine-hydrolyzing) [Blastocatellia bacterium]HAF21633.1 asparagine synthase (glutamine-hydrolyzing) [Blastocatellia bacterium]HCX29929.1 asparagine synthase (glutamine-hydrolyzing) [Blastocatellia bacterium]
MCGIVGIVRSDSRTIDEVLLSRMCAAIRHRGPDDDGFYINGPVGLGMRRLAIIDLQSGRQPIHNQDRTAWIVFNGEIYNYRELRNELEKFGHTFYTNSDTEAIIHAYDQYGIDCPKHLRGMFAFAIWDERTQELFLARDRVGKKPILYAQVNGQFVFGSEFSALLQHPDISRDIDSQALHYYLSFMCVPAPHTAYRAIKKLEPGHTLRWKKGEIKIERYWQPDFSRKVDISEQEAGERAIEILRDAVRVRLMSEVPLGAFLSGGIDSSAVVALMSEESSAPVKTFSIGFEEQDFSELHHARRVAEHVGADHHEFIVRPDALEVLPLLVEHYGEPYADSSAIPTYYVARETRKHVTVALNGDGGDESFAGYERYAAMRLAETYHRLPSLLRDSVVKRAIGLIPSSETKRSRVRDLKRFLQAASLPRLERYLRWVSVFDDEAKQNLYSENFQRETQRISAANMLDPWFARANGSGIVDASLLTDMMTYLPNDLLVKVDIATMAVSLEARSPFLDHKVIEFAASLPEKFKLRGLTTKYLLKRILKKILPAENLDRRKMGFGVPVGHWLRGKLQPFLRETLLSEKALKRGLFKPEAVKQLVELHTRGERDYSHQLWTLLMLELWFERFID